MVGDATGYGRIVRNKDERVARIVEQADAADDELAIKEINTSIYVFRRGLLAPALRRLSPENAQGEYYLTDIVEVLHRAGYPVTAMVVDDPMEAAGVNDRAQLAVAEAELRDRTNERWMRRGVTMIDPERTYVDASVELAADVTLFPGTLLQGHTVIAGGRRSAPTAIWSTARWASGRRSPTRWGATPTSGTTPSSGLLPPSCRDPGGAGSGDGTMLHGTER